ncbi:MAG TPA: hypothetical protein VIU86_20170 [Gaiellaceae bacterium]
MTAEELEEKLADLPAQPPRPPPPLRHLLMVPAREALDALRRAAPANEPTDEAHERAALEARRERIRTARAALEPRIRNAKLLTALRRLDTRCALLLGPTGEGKTSAALWARQRHRGAWMTARDLGASERRHPLGEALPPLLREALRAPVLYLDDLGTEESRDLGVLQYVIDQRYASGRATFVTSGLTPKGLAEYLGAPTLRRLVEQHVARGDGSEWPVLQVDLHGGAL